MRTLLSVKRLSLCIVLLSLLLVEQHLQLFQRGWLQLQEWQHASQRREHSVWLPDYVTSLQGIPIEGFESDVSSLTYDPDRRSLFAVTNRRPHIIELSLDGQVLRSIPLVGFGDPEAIEYISPGLYVITDEREQRLVKVRLTNETKFVDAADAQQLSLGIDLSGNKGFEGLAYDSAGQRLFVAKERDPVRIYEIRGFPYASPDKPVSIHVRDDPARDEQLFVHDLSGLEYSNRTGHLLALSDESRLLLELNTDGTPISSLSLRARRHGLKHDIPQAEGVAIDDAGTIYIVSEPNLFYVFKKKAVEQQ